MPLEESIAYAKPRLIVIREHLQREAEALGFSADDVQVPAIDELAFECCRDPASGLDSLVGTWRDGRGRKLGQVTLHADGTFYSEFDVVKRHPRDRYWFVESVTAWGNNDKIKSDPQLLAAVD